MATYYRLPLIQNLFCPQGFHHACALIPLIPTPHPLVRTLQALGIFSLQPNFQMHDVVAKPIDPIRLPATLAKRLQFPTPMTKAKAKGKAVAEGN